MMVLPVILGAAAVAAFLLGGGSSSSREVTKPEDKSALEKASKAVKAKDWQTAVAEALASGSVAVINTISDQLRKAGKDSEADSLLDALKQIEKAVNEVKLVKVTTKNKETGKVSKKVVKVITKPKPEASKPAKSAPKALPAPKPAPKPATKPKPAPNNKAKADPPELVRAKDLARHLSGTSRYNEDRSKVRAYQIAEKLSPVDEKYGRDTARTLWARYRIIPPNPFYWPSTNTKAAVATYDKFLQDIVTQDPSTKTAVEKLRKTLGK